MQPRTLYMVVKVTTLVISMVSESVALFRVCIVSPVICLVVAHGVERKKRADLLDCPVYLLSNCLPLTLSLTPQRTYRKLP